MTHLVDLDEHGPTVRAGVVAVTLLEALRVPPPHSTGSVARAREAPLELVATLVEAASRRAVRIDRVPARERKEDEVFVVRGSERRPAESRIRMLAAQADVEP